MAHPLPRRPPPRLGAQPHHPAKRYSAPNRPLPARHRERPIESVLEFPLAHPLLNVGRVRRGTPKADDLVDTREVLRSRGDEPVDEQIVSADDPRFGTVQTLTPSPPTTIHGTPAASKPAPTVRSNPPNAASSSVAVSFTHTPALRVVPEARAIGP